MANEGNGRNARNARRKSAPEQLWTPVFLLIIGATLGCFLVGQGANAGTSVYLDRMGGTATLAGIGAAVFSGAAALSRLLCGPLIDARGRRIVMVAGAAVMLAGTVGPLFSNHDAPFIVWRFLQGMGFAMGTTASATAAADVLPLSRLGEGIGYYGLGQALAMSVGPALALFLVSTEPAENLYIGLTCAAVLALAFALLCRYEKNPANLPATSAYRRRWESENAGAPIGSAGTPETGAEPDAPAPVSTPDAPSDGSPAAERPSALRAAFQIFEPRALPGTIPMLFISPAFGFGIFFVGLYGTSLGVGSPGVFYTISAVVMIIVRLKSRSFMDTVAAINIMGAAVVCGLAAYALLFGCSTLDAPGARDALFYLAGVPYGVSLGIALPINQTVAVRNTPDERWGAANALYLLASDVGIGAASVAWGIVNDAFGFTATILCVMACIAASFVTALLCYPPEEKRGKKKRRA